MVVVCDPEQLEIRQVWADNIEHEMGLIRDIVDEYPYIAMHTESPLPGIQSKNTINMLSYEGVKINVNRTKLIKLCLTFTKADGRLPTCGTDKHCAWQFNFCEFDWNKDPHDEYLIDLLAKGGIDFERNAKHGVEATKFGELLTSSGMVMKDDVYWITFNGALDFGYLVKILTGNNLPETRAQFDEAVKVYFPALYDIMSLLSHTEFPAGGLGRTAHLLGIKRVGTCYQAGSESFLTNRVFLKLRDEHFSDQADLEKHAGVIYGVE